VMPEITVNDTERPNGLSPVIDKSVSTCIFEGDSIDLEKVLDIRLVIGFVSGILFVGVISPLETTNKGKLAGQSNSVRSPCIAVISAIGQPLIFRRVA
jgi:hypothetical protein